MTKQTVAVLDHAFQQQMSRGMGRIRKFNYTDNSGTSRDLHSKIQTLFQLIEPISPDDPNFKSTFLNVVNKWGSHRGVS